MKPRSIIWGTGNAWPALSPHHDRPKGNTSVSFIYRQSHLLFDCGAGCADGIIARGLSVPAVLFGSHAHPDHVNRHEMNLILRLAHLRSTKERIRFVATERTWLSLPGFERASLEWVPVEPDTRVSLTVDGTEFVVDVLDAADHFPGGVVFVVSVDGFRFGALFDKKSWGSTEVLESLDLAVIETNSITRLAPKTGHVGLWDNIDMLRSLQTPPRFTALIHYGTDDQRVLSCGSLAAMLPAVAGGLSLGWANPGWEIDWQDLPPRNPIALIDEENRVCGVASKNDAHSSGLLHASVLTLVRSDRKLVLYKRPPGKSHPGKLDSLGGGHMDVCDGSPRATALREAREEVLVSSADRVHQIMIDDAWLTQLSDDFALESVAPKNRERSTLFGLDIPPGLRVRGEDICDDSGNPITLELSTVDWDDLIKLDLTSVADGLARIIRLADHRRVRNWLES